jgi:hypothetical protein
VISGDFYEICVFINSMEYWKNKANFQIKHLKMDFGLDEDQKV